MPFAGPAGDASRVDAVLSARRSAGPRAISVTLKPDGGLGRKELILAVLLLLASWE